MNFAKSLLIPRPIPSTVNATAFTCILPRFIGGGDMDDYNTPKPPVYRVIVPSQNRNGCFLLANQHSLLPASSLHACSAARTSAPRDGARACTGMRHEPDPPQQSMLPAPAKTVVSLLITLVNAIMWGGRYGLMTCSALMAVPYLRYHRNMTRLFLRLFMWLSFTVLSLQGGAAMAIGQAEVPAHATMAMAGHAHHQVASQDRADHCCESGTRAAAASHAKCPACAGCCVGTAAPPARLPDFHVPSTPSSPHAGVEAAMTSFVPATLERPPRGWFV